jgi:hypothetical protein
VVVVAEPLVQALVELNGVMLAGPLLSVASVPLLLNLYEEPPTGGFGDDGCLWSNPGTWTKEVAKLSGLVDNLVAIGVENLCGGRDEETFRLFEGAIVARLFQSRRELFTVHSGHESSR